ncbi:succinate dehydrogenase [Methanomicrobiaceae archaeon CYW5]|uniref:fumarate reductase (CoM/CoB) subunit TfrA n=1 Tax=Methanovulcanius yangii TaxID=1789227 RepID=UPI0029CA7987|nr:fumarate reductase (CoM/CoB) subunit TfrA [Methanovulcanius yangii]MBT8508374.1 succinate dehydrogenase [Methanovulcanius yangii]
MPGDDVVDCHVLVIGSGGAGCRAALEAQQYGETVLLSRTLTGKGGCTIMAEGGYNAVLNENDSCLLHFEDTLRGGAYLNDPELADVLVTESPDRFFDLARWGSVFDVAEDFVAAQRPFGGQRFNRTCYASDRSGHEIMATLVEQVRNSDIIQIQEEAAIELLMEDGRAAGAFTLDTTGTPNVIRADAVVLATGGGTQVYDISTNCAAGTGDGFAIGWRAGAELIDMEMVQFHPTGAVYPPDARGRLITEAVRGEGGVLKNRDGERFMARYDPERMELSTRDVVSRSIETEILEGRGSPHGGVYLDVSHLPAALIEERLPIMLEQYLKFGVDIRTEPMEVAPTAHHIMGGLRITPACETTIPYLYACGEVTGGVHGANRLGGNALADTQVFGKRAGEGAGKSPVREKADYAAQLAGQEKRLSRFAEGTTPPHEIVSALKRTMWNGVGIFRTKERLLAAQEEVVRLRTLVPRAYGPQGYLECCTVENMLCLASLIIRGALIREESRGAHVRKDITQDWTPETSPFGHTVLRGDTCLIERKGGAA